MPSAWGSSWGSAWGNSWGTISVLDDLRDRTVIDTQPGGAVTGSILSQQPIVSVRLQSGAVDATYNGRIRAILVGGNAQIIGDTVYAVNGVATYTTLRLDGTGPQLLGFFTLDDPTVAGVESTPINMAQAQAGSSYRGRRAAGGRGR